MYIPFLILSKGYPKIYLFMILQCIQTWRGTPGLGITDTLRSLRRKLHTSHWKTDSDPLVASFVRVTYYFNYFATRTELASRGPKSVFQWDVWIGVQNFLRKLRSPYVIPRPGVPRHMYVVCISSFFSTKISDSAIEMKVGKEGTKETILKLLRNARGRNN